VVVAAQEVYGHRSIRTWVGRCTEDGALLRNGLRRWKLTMPTNRQAGQLQPPERPPDETGEFIGPEDKRPCGEGNDPSGDPRADYSPGKSPSLEVDARRTRAVPGDLSASQNGLGSLGPLGSDTHACGRQELGIGELALEGRSLVGRGPSVSE
jgi:hypothetical protein